MIDGLHVRAVRRRPPIPAHGGLLRSNEKLTNSLNLALGALSALCGVANHPDATTRLVFDTWQDWGLTWTQVLRHEHGMTLGEVEKWMKVLFGRLAVEGKPEAVQAFRDLIERVTPGIFGGSL